MKNQSSVSEFLIVGILDFPHLQIVFFLLILMIYFLSLLGNLILNIIVCIDTRLHTPMCSFLLNLSIIEICYIFATVPVLLLNFLRQHKFISFEGCMTQMYFIHFLGCTESLVLAAMAYDRFLAICRPLRYTALLGGRTCLVMAAFCWAVGSINATTHTSITSQLDFCGPNNLNHFLCDMAPLLKLACSDTFINDLVVGVAAGLVGLCTGLLKVLSYVYIIITICHMESSLGWKSAFSTCVSHMVVETLLFGTGTFTYILPTSSTSYYLQIIVSLCYSILNPLLNPLIYSLRNREVNRAMREAFQHDSLESKEGSIGKSRSNSIGRSVEGHRLRTRRIPLCIIVRRV